MAASLSFLFFLFIYFFLMIGEGLEVWLEEGAAAGGRMMDHSVRQ